MNDEIYDEACCRWAEDEYGIKNVTEVRFEPRYVEDCPTCGGESFIEVEVRYLPLGKKDPEKVNRKTFEVEYGTKLIRSILAHALGGKP